MPVADTRQETDKASLRRHTTLNWAAGGAAVTLGGKALSDLSDRRRLAETAKVFVTAIQTYVAPTPTNHVDDLRMIARRAFNTTDQEWPALKPMVEGLLHPDCDTKIAAEQIFAVVWNQRSRPLSGKLAITALTTGLGAAIGAEIYRGTHPLPPSSFTTRVTQPRENESPVLA